MVAIIPMHDVKSRKMSGLKAVVRTSLGEQVALQLAAMITGKRWLPGHRLPPETELCKSLNIGRSTLREALKALAFTGLVRMRAGDGTYVAEPSRGLLDAILARGLLKTEKDLTDVCETRMILETEVAALAAQRATTDGINDLQKLIEEGRNSLRGAGRSYVDVDLDFHLAIAHCSGNKVLPRLLIDIRGLLLEWIAKSQELPGLRDNAQADHERIFRSIQEHDLESARIAMQSHLAAFQKAFTLLCRMSDNTVGMETK